VMCEDLEAALAAAQAYGVTDMPQGRNWLRLPDGLVVEYRVGSPPRDMMTAQVITTPYHLVALPKRAGDVKFEKVP